MPDLLAGLPADAVAALAAPPIEHKRLLELTLEWPGVLTDAEARAARRLRVFVLTWDPFDWLKERGPAFATATGDGKRESCCSMCRFGA